MLLLDFLRSVPHVLKTGPIPVAQQRRRKRKVSGDDSDGAEQGSASEAEDSVELSDSRGTVLVTLRNVSPYVMW